MSIACSFLGHSPSSKPILNDGYCFSTCSRCGSDLLEDDERGWVPPPKGYRVVWKRRDPPADYLRPTAPERISTSGASPLQEKRTDRERRANSGGALPAFLGGNDRRRGDRRKSLGTYRANRRKALIAQSGPDD